jgi:hypothetical protein
METCKGTEKRKGIKYIFHEIMAEKCSPNLQRHMGTQIQRTTTRLNRNRPSPKCKTHKTKRES